MNLIHYKQGTLTLTLPLSLILWFSVLSLMFILFFIGGPSYYSSPVFKEFWNIGHIVFFALSTYQLIALIKQKSTLVIIIVSFFYCILLGGAIELIQSKIGRCLDLHDIYRDGLGSLLAFSVFYIKKIKQQYPPIQKSVYLAYFILFSSLVLIITDQSRLYQIIKIDLQARNNFPILADFKNKKELKQWSGNNLTLSRKHVLTGLYSMKVVLTGKTKYSGFSLKHFPSNWHGYQYLLINIYNPDIKPLKICMKITDFDHDINNQAYNNRFNKCYTLNGEQWSNIKIPLEDIKNNPKNRELDLTDMSQLGMFTSGLEHNRIIFLDAISLI